MVAASGRLEGARQGRGDHHRVGAAGNGLGDVAAGAHTAVGDDVAVASGLLEVAYARGRRVGHCRGLRHTDAEHLPVVQAAPGPTPTSTPMAPVLIRW